MRQNAVINKLFPAGPRPPYSPRRRRRKLLIARTTLIIRKAIKRHRKLAIGWLCPWLGLQSAGRGSLGPGHRLYEGLVDRGR